MRKSGFAEWFLLLLLVSCAAVLGYGQPGQSSSSFASAGIGAPDPYTVAGIRPGMTADQVTKLQGPIRGRRETGLPQHLQEWSFDRCDVYLRDGRVMAVRGADAARGAVSLTSDVRDERIRRIGREPLETLRFEPTWRCGSPIVRDTFAIGPDGLLVVISRDPDAGRRNKVERHRSEAAPPLGPDFWLGSRDVLDAFFSPDDRGARYQDW